MGRSFSPRAKAAAPAHSQPVLGLQRQLSTPSLFADNRSTFGEEPMEEGKAPDIATQMAHALKFGATFGKTANQATVQRQPEEEEDLNLKPETALQRQAMPEEEEEVQMKPQIQREPMPEEEEKLQMKPQLQREALPEEDEELQMKPQSIQLKCDECAAEDAAKQEKPTIQPKLTIGQPGDKYEQEADSMAAKVMTMPDSAVQRQVMSQEEDETLQAKPENLKLKTQNSKLPSLQAKGTAPTVPANFDSQLAQHQSSGQPLSDDTRAFMEPRFGADFSNVRVHETPDLANAIQAQAFTHGQDIYFNSGKYNPGSSGGKELLAHELTHVVQQREKISLQSEEQEGVKPQKQTQKTQERMWYEQNPSPKVEISNDLLVLWNFPINKALVQPAHKRAIRNFVKNREDLFWLKNRSFNVIGRASVSGSDELNLSLSERRAQAVGEVLFNALSDIESTDASNHQIHAFGQGSTEIIALPNSPIGSAMSRRVDIKIGKPSDSPRSPTQSETPESSTSRKKVSRSFRFRPFISVGISPIVAADYLIFEIFDLNNKRTALFHYLGAGAGISVGGKGKVPVPDIGASMAGSWQSFKTSRPISLEDFEGNANHASIGLQVGVGPTFESLYLRNPVNFGVGAIELNWGGWWEVGGANAGGLVSSGKTWIQTVVEDISSTHAKNKSDK